MYNEFLDWPALGVWYAERVHQLDKKIPMQIARDWDHLAIQVPDQFEIYCIHCKSLSISAIHF
jgi:hypothetical protein